MFQGDYNNYECGLEISDADAEDNGDWTCEFEYWDKAGVRGDAEIVKVKIFSEIHSDKSEKFLCCIAFLLLFLIFNIHVNQSEMSLILFPGSFYIILQFFYSL